MLENIIGVNEASEITGLSAGTIKNYCADGKIISKKVGNTWVIDKIKLESDYKMKRVYEELLKVVDEQAMSSDGHYLSFYGNTDDYKEQTGIDNLDEFNVNTDDVTGSFITFDSAGSTGGNIYTDAETAFDDIMWFLNNETVYRKYIKNFK